MNRVAEAALALAGLRPDHDKIPDTSATPHVCAVSATLCGSGVAYFRVLLPTVRLFSFAGRTERLNERLQSKASSVQVHT